MAVCAGEVEGGVCIWIGGDDEFGVCGEEFEKPFLVSCSSYISERRYVKTNRHRESPLVCHRPRRPLSVLARKKLGKSPKIVFFRWPGNQIFVPPVTNRVKVSNSPPKKDQEKAMTSEPNGTRTYSNIKHTILVLSGKGGSSIFSL